MPREKDCVRCLAFIWNTDAMRTETYFDDSLITKQEIFCNLQMLTCPKKQIYDSIIASGDISEAGVVTDLFSPIAQEKSSKDK